MGRVLQISKEEYEALPKTVKDALITNRPILVMDLEMIARDIPLCLSYNGEIFNMESPCLHPFCKFFIPGGRQHFHSENDLYVFQGDLAIGHVEVSPTGKTQE